MNVTIIVPSLDPDEKLNQVVEGLLQDGLSLGLLRGDHGSFGARVTAPSEPELQM